ncbi:hypothetical protein [Streptomyces sp. WMMC940]|uniref:hypothetical protein n=1 Tax=Streptomyces sp. WMMC940 TaxID=3015153 RepID=UPI0022B73304|nr:hypothetical protein [Streptomyces sp. WMMC940]MCZ7456095.1 hypothetical protein [Streptomyces sp. WMMC940]
MTTMHLGGDEGQDLPFSVVLNSTLEDFLSQVEREAAGRRREARALRRRIRRQRRRQQPLRARVVRFIGRTGSAALVVVGAVAFVAAGVFFLGVGDSTTARDLFAVAAASWGGACALKIFSG